MHRPLIKSFLVVLVALLLLWLAFGCFGIQALFMDTTVNEPIPVGMIQQAGQLAPMEQATSSQPTLSGKFEQGDSTYRIQGNATIVREGATSTLVLSDFDVTNGPDLFVYLVAATSTENSHVKQQTKNGGFIQIAPLKGNRGNQTYLIPANVDLSAYPVVSIWCRRFSRNFGSANLRSK